MPSVLELEPLPPIVVARWRDEAWHIEVWLDGPGTPAIRSEWHALHREHGRAWPADDIYDELSQLFYLANVEVTSGP